MKKFILLFIFCSIFALPKLQAQYRGTTSAGVNLSYDHRLRGGGIGPFFQYNLNDFIRGSLSYDFFIPLTNDIKFKSHSISLDLHLVARLTDNIWIYPIFGGNFLIIPDKKQTKIKRKINASYGFGAQYDLNYHSFLFVEGKQLISDKNPFQISLGYGYRF